jgi:hypothetical protein
MAAASSTTGNKEGDAAGGGDSGERVNVKKEDTSTQRDVQRQRHNKDEHKHNHENQHMNKVYGDPGGGEVETVQQLRNEVARLRSRVFSLEKENARIVVLEAENTVLRAWLDDGDDDDDDDDDDGEEEVGGGGGGGGQRAGKDKKLRPKEVT